MLQSVFFDRALNDDVVFRSQWMALTRSRRLAEGWIVSSSAGAWALLSDEEHELLQSVALPARLFGRLERLGLILTADNASEVAAQNARWSEPHIRHPVHHIIVGTLRCNLSCSYCHAAVVPANASRSYDLTIERAEQILDFALHSSAPDQSFEFQGGESILNWKTLVHIIPRILAAYRARGDRVSISIQSNGTALSDKSVGFLREHGVRIGTSYDGDDDVHDANRRTNAGEPTSARTRAAIERHKLPFLPTTSLATLAKWQQTIDCQLYAGSDVIAFQPVYPINSAMKNWHEVGIEEDEFLDAYRKVTAYLRSLWRPGYYPLERRQLLAIRKLMSGRDVDFADFGNPCGMVHSQILYNYNGDIFTCDEGRDFADFKIGNVTHSRYEDVVFGAKTRKLKSLSIPNDAECQSCALRAYCSTCPVLQRAIDGELSARWAGTEKCNHTKQIFDDILEVAHSEPRLIYEVAQYHGIRISSLAADALGIELCPQ